MKEAGGSLVENWNVKSITCGGNFKRDSQYCADYFKICIERGHSK